MRPASTVTRTAPNAARADIGIVGETDILAVDQASVDQIYAMPEDQKRDIHGHIESRRGRHRLECMRALRIAI